MTPLNAIVAAASEIEYLSIDELEISPLNPRKSHDPAKIAEIAESIREHGILVPLLIRRLPIEGDVVAYHIVAGSRRWAGARIAEKFDAPCIVREMTDDEARELAIVDNLQREEMPALEEADGYEALRQVLGTAAAIAARVGKPIEYVAKRLRLVTLGNFSRQALAERLITIDHALLLARLGREDEEEALKWTLDHSAGIKVKLDKVIEGALSSRRNREKDRHGAWEPQSVARLKNYIERESGRALSKAPWDLDDATLAPEVGPCNGCPQNTASNGSLFDDLNIANATCADGICFEWKRGAYVQIQLLAAGGEKKAARLSWKSSTVRPKMGLLPTAFSPEEKPGDPRYTAHLSRVLREGQWRAAKKGSCPYVITGVTVDWYDGYGEKKRKPGETLTVCVTEKCKAHPKSYEKKAAESGGGSTRQNEQQIEAKRKAYIEAERPVREAIYDALIKSGKVTHDGLFRMLLADMVDYRHAEVASRRKIQIKNAWDTKPIVSAILQAPKTELDAWAFDLIVVPEIEPGKHVDTPAEVKSDREDLWKFAKYFGVDVDAVAAKFDKAPPPKPAPKKAAAKPAPKKSAPAKKAPAKKAVKKAVKVPAKKAAAKKAAKPAKKKVVRK